MIDRIRGPEHFLSHQFCSIVLHKYSVDHGSSLWHPVPVYLFLPNIYPLGASEVLVAFVRLFRPSSLCSSFGSAFFGDVLLDPLLQLILRVFPKIM